ncbi:MAG: hypothetical protein ABJA80_04010 [bacterium]
MTNFTRPGRLWLPEAPHLLTRGRTIEPKSETILAGPRYEGWITVERIHARTGDVTFRSRFKNLITDAGLIGLGATFTLYQLTYLAVGTSNAAPTTAQTTLGGEVGRTSFDNGVARTEALGGGSTYWRQVFTRLFTEAQANGNLAELGMFSASTGGVMWMRQLIRDTGGVPTVITKTSADQLRVTYEIRQYWPTADQVTVTNINGIDYTFTMRPCNVTNPLAWGPGSGTVNGMLYAFGSDTSGVYANAVDGSVLSAAAGTGIPGTQSLASSIAVAAYASPNFYRDNTFIYEPGTANYGTGIGGLSVCVSRGAQQMQVSIAPRIPKLDTQRLTLQLRSTWGRGP